MARLDCQQTCLSPVVYILWEMAEKMVQDYKNGQEELPSVLESSLCSRSAYGYYMA